VMASLVSTVEPLPWTTATSVDAVSTLTLRDRGPGGLGGTPL